MRRLRALLVAFTVAAVVLGTMGTAFAAGTQYSDVAADSSIAGAVARLNALEILKGYPDGTFKPDSPITRAEFAAVAARAAGLSAAASATAGQTRFSDVPAGHWAVGYINAATTAGLLMGYPDGTFKPDQQVTQAEALTILVRALGYGPVVKGEWPNNYVNQASALGLTDGVSVSANLPATRGVVAQFVDNTLETETLVQRGYGDLAFYEPSGKTFAQEKLGLKVWDKGEAFVTANARTDDSLDADEVEVSLNTSDSDKEDEFRDIFGSTTKKFTVLSGIDTEALLGTEVEIWAKNNQIVYAKSLTDSDNIKQGYLNYDGSGDPVTNTKVWIDEDEYDFASGAVAYVTDSSDTAKQVTSNFDSIAGSSEDGKVWVRAVLNDDDEVVLLDVFKWENSLVVTSVDKEDNEVEGVDLNTGDDSVTVELDEDAITWGGKEISAADINEGDLVYVADGGAFVAVAQGSKVSGTLEDVSTDKDGDPDAVTIGDKEYDVVGTLTAYYSADDNDSVEELDAAALDGELDDLIGEEVTVYLDGKGEVRYIVGTAAVAANEQTAVALAAQTIGRRTVVTLLTADGKMVDYDATADTDFKKDHDDIVSDVYAENAILGLGTLIDAKVAYVKFTLNEDGDLDVVKVQGYTDDTGNEVGTFKTKIGTISALNDDNRTMTFTPTGGSATTVTIAKNATVYDLEEEDVFTGLELVNGSLTGTPKALYRESAPGIASTVVILSDDSNKISYGAEGKETGIVVGRSFKSSGDTVTLVLLGGEKVTYQIDRDDLRGLSLGEVIKVDVQDNKVTGISTANISNLATVQPIAGGDRDGPTLKVGTAVYTDYALDEGAVIVDASDDYSTVSFNALITSDNTVDTDYSGYKATVINADDDQFAEFVVIEE